MRILYASLGFLPAAGWGGLVKVAHVNALEVQRRGHEVVVCASNLFDKHRRITPRTAEDVVDGLRVVYLRTAVMRRWPGTLGPSALSPAALARLWEEVGRADVVHVHGWRDAVSTTAAFFAWAQRKPLALQPHGSLPRITNSLRVKRVFDGLVTTPALRAAERLVALQGVEAEQIVRAGGERVRVRVIPNGLDDRGYDPERFRGAFRRAMGIVPERRIVLFVGRLNRNKGPDLLVRAFARIPEPVRARLHLVVVGPDEGELAALQAFVRERGLDGQVTFPGLLTGDLISAAFVDAELLVVPSRKDAFPMTLVEACQAGTPAVVTDACEIADLVSERAARVTPIDETAIAEAMQTLLTCPALHARLAAGGRALLRDTFSIQAVGDRLEEMYGGMLGGEGRRHIPSDGRNA